MTTIAVALEKEFADEWVRASNGDVALEGWVEYVDGRDVLLSDAVPEGESEPVGTAAVFGATSIVPAEPDDGLVGDRAESEFLDSLSVDGDDAQDDSEAVEESETPGAGGVPTRLHTDPDAEFVVEGAGAGGGEPEPEGDVDEDGDVAVLEPERIADRSDPADGDDGDQEADSDDGATDEDDGDGEDVGRGETVAIELPADDLSADLSDGALELLECLQADDEQPVGVLAEQLDLSTGAVHGRLQELREEDLVDARPDPDDGRRKLYSADLPEPESEDGDDQANPLSCSCGATLDDSLEYAIHRTEDHEKTRYDLGHLEPGEFGEIVEAAADVQDVVDAVGFSTERVLRMLAIYDLDEVVGPSDVEVSDITDVDFDGVVDDAPAEDDEPDDDAPDDDRQPETPAAGTPDGGAVAIGSSTVDGGSVTCRNCGSKVTKDYARVCTPDGEEEQGPRVCPNCPDMIRDGDGTIREARSARRADGNHGGSE